MSFLYSYILRYDDGAAPNPYGGICTLAICKPKIRLRASIGDWVIGTGSKNAWGNDGIKRNRTGFLVYAMKISDIMTMHEYDSWCQENLPVKIPVEGTTDWKQRIGDCLYYLDENQVPCMREYGQHKRDKHYTWDTNGERVLLANRFYYFGENPLEIPQDLTSIIKKNQGYRKITDEGLIHAFEIWIQKVGVEGVNSDPHLREGIKKQILRNARLSNNTICRTSGNC